MTKIIIFTRNSQFFLMLRHLLAVEGFVSSLIVELEDEDIMKAGFAPGSAIAVFDSKTVSAEQILRFRERIASIPAVLLLTGDPRMKEGVDGFNLVLEGPLEPIVLLRFLRKYCAAPALQEEAGVEAVLRYSDLLLIRSQFRVFRNGQRINVTPLQFRLLEKLMQEPEKVWTRQALIDAVWGVGGNVEPRTVDIHIGHIRRALASVGPNIIRTVHSQGYSLDQLAER